MSAEKRSLYKFRSRFGENGLDKRRKVNTLSTKEKRFTMLKNMRNIPEDLDLTVEQTEVVSTPKTDVQKNRRLDLLRKWKEEKMRKKAINKKTEKPPFKVSRMDYSKDKNLFSAGPVTTKKVTQPIRTTLKAKQTKESSTKKDVASKSVKKSAWSKTVKKDTKIVTPIKKETVTEDHVTVPFSQNAAITRALKKLLAKSGITGSYESPKTAGTRMKTPRKSLFMDSSVPSIKETTTLPKRRSSPRVENEQVNSAAKSSSNASASRSLKRTSSKGSLENKKKNRQSTPHSSLNSSKSSSHRTTPSKTKSLNDKNKTNNNLAQVEIKSTPKPLSNTPARRPVKRRLSHQMLSNRRKNPSSTPPRISSDRFLENKKKRTSSQSSLINLETTHGANFSNIKSVNDGNEIDNDVTQINSATKRLSNTPARRSLRSSQQLLENDKKNQSSILHSSKINSETRATISPKIKSVNDNNENDNHLKQVNSPPVALSNAPCNKSGRSKKTRLSESLWNNDQKENLITPLRTAAVKSNKKYRETPSKRISLSDDRDEIADHFTDILDSEIDRINDLCKQWHNIKDDILKEKDDGTQTENAIGLIDMNVGQSKLLITKKFNQFRGLIEKCRHPQEKEKIGYKELKGFWELVYLQVIDLNKRFENLETMRKNNWSSPKKTTPIKKQTKKKKSKPNTVASSMLKQAIEAARKKKAAQRKMPDSEVVTPSLPKAVEETRRMSRNQTPRSILMSASNKSAKRKRVAFC